MAFHKDVEVLLVMLSADLATHGKVVLVVEASATRCNTVWYSGGSIPHLPFTYLESNARKLRLGCLRNKAATLE